MPPTITEQLGCGQQVAAPQIERATSSRFAAREHGYSFVAEQQEVGIGYFEEVTMAIQGGSSKLTALIGLTAEERFQ